jgi:hypothetical protein
MQSPEIYARLTQLFRDLFDDPELILSPTLTAKERASAAVAATSAILLTCRETACSFTHSEIVRLFPNRDQRVATKSASRPVAAAG